MNQNQVVNQLELVKSVFVTFQTCEQIIRSKVGVCQFIGKNSNGKQILAEASHSGLHKVILELEGKDAAYVHRSCKMTDTVRRLVKGMYSNAGQSRHSISRVYVDRVVADELVEAMLREIATFRMGDPKSPDTKIGPLKLPEVAKIAKKRIQEATGGKVLTGGQSQQLGTWQGTFYEPTLVLGAPRKSALMQEHLFGPVSGVTVVDSVEEAVEQINDSKYGLTSCVFAEDVELIEWMSERLDTGTVFANKCFQVHPGLPWSGRKQSGRSFGLSKQVFEHVTQFKSIHFIY